MSERKSYGQFCGLARALDRIGDRWTLLIVRELLLSPRSFRDLEQRLAGVSPSLLAARLGALVEDELVERNDAPARSKAVEYSLTPAGRALEPAVVELIKWGSRWMTDGPARDFIDPGWAPLALRALLDGAPSRPGCLHVDVEGTAVTVRARGGRRRVAEGHQGRADATLSASLPTVLAIASGVMSLEDAGVAVSGDVSVAVALLAVA